MLNNHLLEATVYENSDPTEVSAYVRRHIGMHELTTDGASDRASLRHATLGNLGLSVISYGAHTTVENASGIDSYHLQFVVSGTCSIKLNHRELVLTPGSGTFINPGVPSSVSYSPDCTKLIINIPQALFRASSIDRLGRVPEDGVRFISDVYDMGGVSTIAHTIELLYLEADERKPHSGFSQTPLELFFAAKMLEYFPNNVKEQLPEDFDHRFFTMIDAFIAAHIRDEISAAELARKCNVSQRTLYDRFTLFKGMTPSAYVKEKKLRKIYAQLSDPTHIVRSVTEMALEYGFNHLGRFSAEYKSIFSELPSETFRRVRTTRQ